MNKPGLGRGLGALLSSTPTADDVLVEIPVDQIEASSSQPRKSFNSETLDELAASIRVSGVIQPVIVRRRATGAPPDRQDSNAFPRSFVTRPTPRVSSSPSSRICSARI